MNQSGQIVAIDTEMIDYLKLSNADEFYKHVALGDITIALEGDQVTITANGETRRFPAETNSLSGILGEFTMVKADVSATSAATEESSDMFELIDTETTEKSTEEQLVADSQEPEEETLAFDDSELFTIKDEDLSIEAEEGKEEIAPLQEETPSGEDELLELILPTDAGNAIDEIDHSKTASTADEEETTPIYIDIERISNTIGISSDDYNMFLDEYIDTALSLEKALQSDNTEEQSEALGKLSHLSNVLHLPFVSDILNQIKHASASERDEYIQSFFTTLGRLSTAHFDEEKPPQEQEVVSAPEEAAEAEAETAAEGERRTPIDLSDIKPIHFDFQLEAAAEDLSLPVELIEEFVNDFIQQAHEETEKMLAAYEKGDLETVQKIGHLLKGTSSNLRINPLSDTLYEIQFNEDIERVPELVRNYWAHFLSLENQFKLISNK